jgi:hypothetical protein
MTPTPPQRGTLHLQPRRTQFWRGAPTARAMAAALCMLGCQAASVAQTTPATSATPAAAGTRPSATPPQAWTEAEQNLRDFDFMVNKVTQNYAGWDHKVTDTNRAALADLTQRLRLRAGSNNPGDMEKLLGEWLAFFKDGHLRVSRNGAGGDAPPALSPMVDKVKDWREAAVRERLSQTGRARNPVEGIWRINDDRYRVAVMRGDAGSYQAVVLSTTANNWRPGQIKATLVREATGGFAVTYRMGDHAEQSLQAKLVANDALLSLSDSFGVWSREWPAARDADEAARLFPVEEMFLRRLSANTLWLRVPDFNDRRSAPLKALLADNAETLNTTHNLVLDLRKNGGGSDYVYAPLIALAYTRPMVSIGVELRASVDNITLRRDALDKVKDSAVTVAQIEAEIKLMEKNLGQYVQPGALPFEIRREKEVRAFPRRIAVLIDGAGSTGEQLLLDLRQSAKVTLMGQHNSAGVLDFANVVGLVTPSGRFGVQWATSRSLRLPNDPVDPDGIPPDVRIPAKVLDPVSYARQWLEKQPP